MARIYVASSWRNAYFPEVVKRLREYGHEVYDFRNPPQGGHGFHWTDIDPNCAEWTFAEYADGLTHPSAEKQFAKGRDYYGTGHQAQIDDYVKAILTKGRPYVTFADAAESASMAFPSYLQEHHMSFQRTYTLLNLRVSRDRANLMSAH